MCEFFSGIQTKNGILFDMNSDSHEFLIKKYNLNDRTREPDFVRLELVPRGEPWNQDPSMWTLHVDQDSRPSWFSEEFAKHEMWMALQRVWNENLIINDTVEEVTGRKVRWIVNSHIGKLSEAALVFDVVNSAIDEMCNAATVGRVLEYSSIGIMRDRSSVGRLSGRSKILEMRNLASVFTMEDFSSISLMKDNAKVTEMFGESYIGTMEGFSSVEKIYRGAEIGLIEGTHVRIRHVKGGREF